MAQNKLNALSQLAEKLSALPDTRPVWLRAYDTTNDAAYYRFLWEFAKQRAPFKMLEIGTYCGNSAAMVAAAKPEHKVVTLDINPDAAIQVAKLPLTNVHAVTVNSSHGIWNETVKENAPYDVLYIDGWHNFNNAYGEYYLYRPLVKDGGIIFFDDLALTMEYPEMEVFWEFVVDPKIRLDALHATGWGACVKDETLEVPAPNDVVVSAEVRMQELKAEQSKQPTEGLA